MTLPRIHHSYAGAEWMQQNLDAFHVVAARSKRGKPSKVAKTMSPLGIVVADVLGLVWRGIYHMDDAALLRARWDNPHHIEVRAYGGLATWDFSELTQLVVICHDLFLRLEVRTSGPRHIGLAFWQRHTRDGGMAERLPAMDDHVAMIRKLYTLEHDAPEPETA